jgi:hypothetical protein
MLGFNGGLLGKKRKQEPTTPGLWFPNERAIIVGSDPYWDNVVLLLQPNKEANNSTVFTDLSSYGRTLTANGNVKIDTSVTRFGRPTILADGTGDTISAADSASLELSRSNFTLEVWLEPFSQTRQYVTLVGRSDASYTGGTWVLIVNYASSTSGDVLFYAENNVLTLQTTGVNVRDGNAHFIQVVRTDNVFDINVDGTNRATTTNSLAFGNSTFPLKIMGEDGSSPNRDAAANVGAVRLTIGVARPNVVPTGPFPVY